MGDTPCTESAMALRKICLAILVLTISVQLVSAEKDDGFRMYRGATRKVEIPSEVRTALEDLNRHTGSYYGYNYHGSSHYRPTYYRPTYYQPSIGNLIKPVVFGLAAVAGGAALASLFPNEVTVTE